MVEEDSTVVATDGVTAADLGGEAVIFNAESGVYFGLNGVGAAVWELVDHPRPVREVVEALLQEYEVAPDRLRQDVVAFLREMEVQGLVQVREDDHA